MSVNDVIDNNIKKDVEVEPANKWLELVEQNRVNKLYSVAEQVVLLAVEWGIDPKDLDEQLLKPLGVLVQEVSLESLKQFSEEK